MTYTTVLGISQPPRLNSALVKALPSEFLCRALAIPERVVVPEASDWRRGYATAARGASVLEERDLDSALATARRFIDPVLAGEAVGRWGPAAMADKRKFKRPPVPR